MHVILPSFCVSACSIDAGHGSVRFLVMDGTALQPQLLAAAAASIRYSLHHSMALHQRERLISRIDIGNSFAVALPPISSLMEKPDVGINEEPWGRLNHLFNTILFSDVNKFYPGRNEYWTYAHQLRMCATRREQILLFRKIITRKFVSTTKNCWPTY